MSLFCCARCDFFFFSFCICNKETKRKADNVNVISGRRYFRLLKWYPCWEIAWEKILAGSSSNGVGGSAAGKGGAGESTTTFRQMLEGMKYAFLGMYFFLEMLTIVRNFSLFLFLLPPAFLPSSPKMSQYTYTSKLPPQKRRYTN